MCDRLRAVCPDNDDNNNYTHSPEIKDNMHYSVSVCVHTQKIQIVKKYYLAILSCVENFLKRMDA